MIYVHLGGRCGNQLFAYAFAKSLQKLQNDKITFNTITIDKNSNKSFWELALDRFCLSEYQKESVENGFIYKYGNVVQRIINNHYYKTLNRKKVKKSEIDVWKWRIKMQTVLNRFGIYDVGQGYFKPKKSIFKNKFVLGPFEDKRFFDDFRDELIAEIKPLVPLRTKFYDEICEKESVCVTIRRGGFFSKGFIETYGVCDRDYYYKAIDLINKKVPNAYFVFFSDDLDWVKAEFKGVKNAAFEPDGLSIDNKLLYMSTCKHFILSNSTFSWWAQYLSDNADKVVVSPKYWFNMNGFTHPLIDESWILI